MKETDKLKAKSYADSEIAFRPKTVWDINEDKNIFYMFPVSSDIAILC